MSALDRLSINKDYPTHPSNYTAVNGRSITHIVLHYTGGVGSAKNNAKYYSDTPDVGASAHLFVGWASEGAQIYEGVPIEHRAWHAIGWNEHSIGIEIACHNDTGNRDADSPDWYFDDLTIERVLQLVTCLMKDYNIPIENVVRHYDCTGKWCPSMWVTHPEQWENFKAMLSTYQFPGVSTLAPAPTPQAEPTYYRVQVGAFTNKDNATALKDKLVALGFADAYVR